MNRRSGPRSPLTSRRRIPEAAALAAAAPARSTASSAVIAASTSIRGAMGMFISWVMGPGGGQVMGSGLGLLGMGLERYEAAARREFVGR